MEKKPFFLVGFDRKIVKSQRLLKNFLFGSMKREKLLSLKENFQILQLDFCANKFEIQD